MVAIRLRLGLVHMIPKLIHFAWTGLPGQQAPPMPEWAADNIERFRRLNPDYEVRIHGEEALLPKYRILYDAATTFAHTSDLLRYSILQRYGGWWFDADIFPFRPVRDIESAYALDGHQLFVTEQHGQLSKRLTYNGAVMAAIGPECVAWPAIDEALAKLPKNPPRVATGPGLLTELMKRYRQLFVVGAWPWFYPAEIGRAGRLYSMFRRQGIGKATRIAPTGGQLPFTMHLWSGEKAELRESKPKGLMDSYEGESGGQYKGLLVGLAPNRVQWQNSPVCTMPFRAIAEGLTRLGCDVEVIDCATADDISLYDVLIVWNGRKGEHVRLPQIARDRGIPTIYLELGFLARNKHWQADHAGILHWASWSDRLCSPAPEGSAERLAKVRPRPKKCKWTGRKYVLVLGQVPGDSQLDECEINSPVLLDRIVARMLPKGEEGRFRPHPRDNVQRPAYLPRCEAETIEEAIAGARFAITINSNAGNECLALGCPVLCFGPALYAQAGVALRTSMATFYREFQQMLDGWQPEQAKVENYLCWLAARQWHVKEWASGEPFKQLFKEAGI